MPSARGRRVRIADEEEHLIFDPSSPVASGSEVDPSAADGLFECLLEEIRRNELGTIPLPRDGYRSRYCPAGSVPRPIDIFQPSMQEFLNSSEEYFPAPRANSATDATPLKDDIHTSSSTTAYNTFSPKEKAKSSRSLSTSTYATKENAQLPGSPSFTTLRHKLSSIFSGESPSQEDSPNKVTPSLLFLPGNIATTPVHDIEVLRLNSQHGRTTHTQVTSADLAHPAAMTGPAKAATRSLSTFNTSGTKDNVQPLGSPSFTTLRHKLSSIFSGEAPGRDDSPNKVTPLIPSLPGNIATKPVHDSRVLRLNHQHGQTAQTQLTSADLARPATMRSPAKTAKATQMSSTHSASSANLASSALKGTHMSTVEFAAKVKDKATRSKPVLTIDTTRPNRSVPISAASSSTSGEPRKQHNEYSSSNVGKGFMTRSGPTDLSSCTPQDADENELAIFPRSPLVVNQLEPDYHEEAFESSSANDLVATGEPSTPTGDSSSSFFMSPTNLGTSLRRHFSNLILAIPDSKVGKSDANRGAVQSPGLSDSNTSDPAYRNWDADRGTVQSPVEASKSSPENYHGARTMTAGGTASQEASPTSPGRFRLPRKSVGSGDAKAVNGGKKLPKTAQGSSQGESSTSAAQEGAKPKESANDLEAKAKMEEEDYIASKVNELREKTGSQVVWYSPNDLRCRHPKHHRTWYSKNLWCATDNGACACCGAPCCAMAGAIKIVENNRGPATAVAAAKALSQAIGLYVTMGTDESTLMECTSCHRLVCPECCSICPVAACGDLVCKAPDCNPGRQWGICDLHDE